MLPDSAVGPWEEVSAHLEPACKEQTDEAFRVCQRDRAVAYAENGETQSAAETCAAVSDQKWRSECLFLSAEAMAAGQGRVAIKGATELCLSANKFAVQCAAHLVRELARTAPALVRADDQRWDEIEQKINVLTQIAAATDEPFADALKNRAWAQTISVSMQRSGAIEGDMLRALPQPAQPHILAFVAVVLAQETLSQPDSLTARAQQLLAFVDHGERLEVDESIDTQLEQNLWRKYLPQEESLPSIIYLRAMRRAHASERKTDATICVLEALGQLGGPPVSIVSEALEHPDVLVRWTAARLIPNEDKYDRVRAAAADDSEAIVRARSLGQRADR